MEFKVFSSIADCKRIWQSFSSNQYLFDNWNYRTSFFDKKESEPHFIVGKENGRLKALVPLLRNKETNDYSYYGGWFPERNSIFMNDKTKIKELLEKCPDQTHIEGISPNEGKYFKFSEDEYTYYIDLDKYSCNFDNYFNSFGKKKKKNFTRELRAIPKHRTYRNRLTDFKRLVDLSLRQFGIDSIYAKESIRNGIFKTIKLAQKKGMLEMISVEIRGKTEAIDVGIRHGSCYSVVTGSSNNEKIPNIGKLLTVLSIKNAIAKKARYVDFLASSGYWKNFWGFEKEMLLKFDK